MRRGRCSPEYKFSYWRHLVAEKPAGLQENIRMAPIEAAREAQLIREAEHARDGQPKAQEFRPAGEIVIEPPARPVANQYGRRGPNSPIAQIVQLWREGKI